MDVIIVSKTHMANGICVGGVLANGRFVRLMKMDGHNQDKDTPFKVSDVYTIEFQEKEFKKPPHVEDILVSKKEFKFTFSSIGNMVKYLKEKLKVKIWEGNPDNLFDGKLEWTDGGSGYISIDGEIPEHSVGFWISDRPLTKRIAFEKVRYNYPYPNGWRSLPYVGFDEPVQRIPSGTLIRVSLARWWDRNGETEDRCSLQLSGWYDYEETEM